MTRTIRSLFTVLFASSLVLVATPIANATPHPALPAAQVHIGRTGSIGVGGSAVHLWQRCKDGLVVAEGDRPGALITSYIDVPPTTAPDDLTTRSAPP